MRHAIVVAATLTLAACASQPPAPVAPVAQSTAKEAQANLASASGSLVSGRVTIRPMRDGVHLTGVVGGFLPNSVHGFHGHEKGDCTAADAC
jgi:Cu-Zn family superoxide dismutase